VLTRVDRSALGRDRGMPPVGKSQLTAEFAAQFPAISPAPRLKACVQNRNGHKLCIELPHSCMPAARPRPYSLRNVSRSALMVSASVVGMPCGKPLYVFKVLFLSNFADSGPESA
jgi:hypothetical protein